MKWLRALLVLAGLVLVLGAANHTIWSHQQVVDHGRPLLLALRPVDPRSLMQGDYMTLALDKTALPPAASELPRRGVAVLAADGNNIGTFVRLDDGAALKPGEIRVRFQRTTRFGAAEASYGADAFFFQEGDADLYAGARYALVHVAADGSTILVGMADQDRKRIVRPPDRP